MFGGHGPRKKNRTAEKNPKVTFFVVHILALRQAGVRSHHVCVCVPARQ